MLWSGTHAFDPADASPSRDIVSPRAFLFRIAKNLALDDFRKQSFAAINRHPSMRRQTIAVRQYEEALRALGLCSPSRQSRLRVQIRSLLLEMCVSAFHGCTHSR